MIFKKRKGALAAILALCIVIIIMATYVMKWVLDRHMTATRLERSSKGYVRAEGSYYYLESQFVPMNSPVSSASYSLDGQTINITCIANCTSNLKTYRVVIDPG